MDRLTRWVPLMLALAAVTHAAVALTIQSTWGDLVVDGLWNTLDPDDKRRQSDFWFAALTPALFGMAAMGRSHACRTGRLPVSLGVTLIIIGVPMGVLMPVSGGWPVTVIGVLALVAARRSGPARPVGHHMPRGEFQPGTRG